MHVYIFVQLQGEHMILYTYIIFIILPGNIQSAFVLMINYIIFFKVIYMDMSKENNNMKIYSYTSY